MRTLVLLRGCPGSGKSTWLKENNLEQYALSADSIRLLYQSPVLNKDGNLTISQSNDGKVWKLLFSLLEDRMSRGEFTIVDATHYKSTLLNRYRELIKKYRYRVIVADFTDVSLDTLIERNNNRDEFKRVPEEVILKMHTVFQDDKEVSNRFNIINKDEVLPILNKNMLKNFNHYDKVVFFGDIHGCCEPLNEYFSKNPFNESTFYVFLGDYIDRGIQNKEVLQFLMKIRDFNNTLLLEGNHDRYIRIFAEDSDNKDISEEEYQVALKFLGKDKAKELKRKKTSVIFRNKTTPQINSMDKKELRQLCRKFGQLAYFSFGDKVYLATHGGISNLPTIFTQTEDIIKGVGGYSEINTIDENFIKNTEDNFITVHGHRNILHQDAEQFGGRAYNLCDKIEKGGHLRILEVVKSEHGNTHEVIKIKNNIFDEALSKVQDRCIELPSTNNEVLNMLNSNTDINKKILDNGVASYNFSRKVFNKSKWDFQTIKARGLFVDINSANIMARSYDKFFNWGENDFTKSPTLKETFKYPVKCYKKENGFLGIVSYDFNSDSLFVCSKSTNQGDYADMVRDQVDLLDKEYIKEYTKENKCTLIFEVVHPLNDPHIIKYENCELILLDIVANEFETRYCTDKEVENVASRLKIRSKELELTFDDWDSLYSWRQEQKDSYATTHEGWVIVDSEGYRTKMKSKFYRFWKDMRKVKSMIEGNKKVSKRFGTVEEVEVYKLMTSIPKDALKILTIIDIEDMYYGDTRK